MCRQKIYFLACFLAYLFKGGEVLSNDALPNLYFAKSIPSSIERRLADDGFTLVAKKRVVAWNYDGMHYFLVFRGSTGGCGIANYEAKKDRYNIVDLYDECKVIAGPVLEDLVGDGSKAIVVRMRLRANGPELGEVTQFNAYLYVKERSEFCRNDDAGSFANGARVPNSAIKFGPSICR